jgi:hypothetical protein
MAAYPYQLTIVNPDAENGITGWTNITGAISASNSLGSAVPRNGSYSFRTQNTATVEARQDVVLPGEVLTDVDAGGLYAYFAAPQSGYESDADRGRVRIAFYDNADAIIGAAVSGPDVSGYVAWANNYVKAAVPTGTRKIRLTLLGTRVSGTYCDAYWDDFELWLFQGDVPGQTEELDFSAYAGSALPAVVKEYWANASYTYSIISRQDAVGGKALRLTKADGSTGDAVGWLRHATPALIQGFDYQVFARIRFLADVPIGVAIRAGDTGGVVRTYLLRRSGNDLILEYRTSTATTVATAAGVFTGWQVNDDFDFVLEASGTALRGKAWASGDAEPAGWQIDTTHATLTFGAFGIAAIPTNTGAFLELDFLSVGAWGAAAPRPIPPTQAGAIDSDPYGVGSVLVTQVTPPVAADSYDLYGAASADDLPASGPGLAAELMADEWDGAPLVDTGLGDAVTRYHAAYAQTGAYTVRTPIVSATTVDPSTLHLSSAFTVAGGKVRLIWSVGYALGQFDVERKAPGGAFATIAADVTPGSYFDIAPLPVGIYRIKSILGGGDTVYSEERTVTLADLPAWAAYPGLDLWLSGRDILHPNGTLLDTWYDRSGGTNDVTAAGAARATYLETGTDALGGMPSIYADEDDSFSGGAACSYGGNAGLTVIAVIDQTQPIGYRHLIGRDGTLDYGWAVVLDEEGRLQFKIATSGVACSRRYGSAVCLNKMPAVIRCRYNGATGEQSVWVNGVLDNGELEGSVPSTIFQDGPALRVFGGSWGGHAADIAVFTGPLTDEQCAAAESELVSRHDLVALRLLDSSPSLPGEQGVAVDEAGYFYISSTYDIRKYNALWQQVAINSNPRASTALDHIGDCAYHDGKVIAVASGGGITALLIFNASNLARLSVVELGAGSLGGSGVCVDQDRGALWAVNYAAAASVLWRYNLATYASEGTLSLSETLPYAQGISYNPADGQIYVACGATGERQSLYRIDPVTGLVRRTYRRSTIAESEGIDVATGTLYWHITQALPAGKRVWIYGISQGGGSLPGAGEISAAASGVAKLTVSAVSPPTDATTRKIYIASSAAEFLSQIEPGAGAVALDEDWDGSPLAVSGLSGVAATRFFAEYATNEYGTVRSNIASATTVAPSLSLEEDAATQFTATAEIAGLEDATSVQLYIGWSPTGLIAPENLFETLPPPLDPVAVPSLPGLTYWAQVRVLGPGGYADGATVSITMSSETNPWLEVTSITATRGILRLHNVTEEEAGEVQYQTALRADTTYANPIENVVETEDADDDGRLVHIFDLGVPYTQYRSHARRRPTSSDPWSPWFEVLWATILPSDGLDDIKSHWDGPDFGDFQTGTVCARIKVEIGFQITEMYISIDNGAWAPADGTLSQYAAADAEYEYWQFCFDSTALGEAWIRLRFVLDDGATVDHHGFSVNVSGVGGNGCTSSYINYYGPLDAFYRLTVPTGEGQRTQCHPCYRPNFSLGCASAACFGGHIGASHYPHTSPSLYGPAGPDWVKANRGAEIAATFYPVSAGGGFRWQWTWPGEFNMFGIGAGAQVGSPNPPIQAYIFSGPMSSIYSAWANCGSNISAAGVGMGYAVLKFGGHIFSRPIACHTGLPFVMEFTSNCHIDEVECEDGRTSETLKCRHKGCGGASRSVPIRLKYFRPDPENFPRRWEVFAYFVGAYIPSGGGRGLWRPTHGNVAPNIVIIQETIDLEYDLECGGIVFFDNRPQGPTAEANARLLGTWNARPIDVECEVLPPEPPPPIEVEIPPVDVTVWTLCGDVTISGGWGGTPPPNLTEADLVIRRVSDQEIVYADTNATASWAFFHGQYTLPYDVPLEAAIRWRDADGYEAVWSDFVGFIVSYTYEECATQGQPCTLLLEVYEDDRVTVAFEVSTAPGHHAQYLLDPLNYGEQQIDIVDGAATITQVEVIVIDKAQIRGDQDSGWLTERLDSINGRRCRLRRFINPTEGWVTIADGPAGEPRLDESYAAYRWVIQDTREAERELSAFHTTGTTTVLPGGVLNGFGDLVAATAPIIGQWTPAIDPKYATFGTLIFGDYWSGLPSVNDIRTVDPEVVIPAAGESLFSDSVAVFDELGERWLTYPKLLLLWRLVGGTEWNTYTPRRWVGELDGDYPLGLIWDAKLADGTEVRAIHSMGSTGLGPNAPAMATDVELIMVYVGEPTEVAPYHLIGLTLGQFLKNLYDGIYSPRDPESGAVVPTGIRYDEAELLKLVDPVCARLTEPVEDVRAWAENRGYAPTGWCPRLDLDGRISPASQVPPTDLAAQLRVTNAITEPSSEWTAGERVINTIRFTYPRLYVPTKRPDSFDGIAVRKVTQDFQDAASIRRHRRKFPVEFNGELFAAFGDARGNAIGPELGATLAENRWLYIGDRYAYAAQAISVRVMRSECATELPGNWVVPDLSWFPDYATRRRGMLMGGQIMAIDDEDCAWRRMLIEEAFSIPSGS